LRVLVVGGTGALGSRVVRSLGHDPDVVVVPAGRRRGDVQLDLGDPETFGVLSGWDVVVNAADSLDAPPDAALAWVYDQGGTWLDASCEPEVLQRALRLQGTARDGCVVLGAGLSPGLSTLAGARAAERLQHCVRLDLVLRWTPLCGAGRGQVRGRVSLAGSPATWWEQGALCHGPPLSPGPLMSIGPPGRRALAWRAPSADIDLLHASLGTPDLNNYSLPSPAWLGPVQASMPPGFFRWGPTRAFCQGTASLLRAHLLRGRVAPASVLAVARGETRAGCRLVLEDGLGAAARMIAATALLIGRGSARPGVHTIDRITTLAPVLEGMARLGGRSSDRVLQLDTLDPGSLA